MMESGGEALNCNKDPSTQGSANTSCSLSAPFVLRLVAGIAARRLDDTVPSGWCQEPFLVSFGYFRIAKDVKAGWSG